ncbi:serine/threonine-protein phosphatase PP2A catalytic subunit [Pelomyxa schiedti]|nr:serine/threonine-protein phosphatase PP2A catalytic subunit [Pelomyxa schiedti]
MSLSSTLINSQATSKGGSTGGGALGGSGSSGSLSGGGGTGAAVIEQCIELISAGGTPCEGVARQVVRRAIEVLEVEPNVPSVPVPVTVVGNIHGQFSDLMELFLITGTCPDTNFLFLGDYVNFGHQGVECLLLLLCYKIKYPSRITLLRGNHESCGLTQLYGFYSECIRKYGTANLWNSFCELFNCMSIAAVIEQKIFCSHAGLAQEAPCIDQIRVVNRFREVPPSGPMCELLWSDPEETVSGFAPSPRGAGYLYGTDIVTKFTKLNNIDHISRSHQICPNGYTVTMNNLVSTIWSAPNHCNCGNIAAILEVSDIVSIQGQASRQFSTFLAAPSAFTFPVLPSPDFAAPKALPDFFS